MMDKKKFVLITGPTASGKTRVSVEIAKAFQGEIISADSMQIYAGMDIGTAKASFAEMRGVPHHLISMVQPDEDYSVAVFQKDAFSLIDRFNESGILPIVTGGTGLYINSLIYKLDFFHQSRSDDIRRKYMQLADDKSLEDLYNVLKMKDPEYANIVSINDKRRIIRRLEILEISGQKEYNFRQYNDDYDIAIIGLYVPRAVLYERINARVDEMIDQGLAEEARGIYEKYGFVNALNAIGYREFIPYFMGDCGLDETINLIKRNTRRYAKRQMTWFRREERIRWFDVSSQPGLEPTIEEIITYIKGKGF